jgi:hypothetical protein
VVGVPIFCAPFKKEREYPAFPEKSPNTGQPLVRLWKSYSVAHDLAVQHGGGIWRGFSGYTMGLISLYGSPT